MQKVIVSAPCKIHLLGEHAVVYGKPALLASLDLRTFVTIARATKNKEDTYQNLRKVIEPIVTNFTKSKKIPFYTLTISADIPIGAGIGSSASVCAAYIGALLCFLKYPFDLETINKLTYQAEKVFNGNPSGADNTTVVYGGFVWFRKETEDLRIMEKIKLPALSNIAKKFVIINTGTPVESTAAMVRSVGSLLRRRPAVVKTFLDDQERLTRELFSILKDPTEADLVRILRQGERNLEKIGVVSKRVASMIRSIEKNGGAAKICGGGGKKRATGVLLTYHKNPLVVENIAKQNSLPFFRAKLGVEGVKREW